MITGWKSLVQSQLDYCASLWSPSDQASISCLESIARNFTRRINGMEGRDYWERLQSLNIHSQERRRERNQIILVWKLLDGRAEGYTLRSHENARRGRLVDIPAYAANSPAVVRRAKEASFGIKRGKLFNLLPLELRNMTAVNEDTSRYHLDEWLRTVPDQPSIQGRQRPAISNSLLEQLAIRS